MKPTPATLILGAVLSAALAACGQQVPASSQADQGLVTLSLSAPIAKAVKTQGVPTDAGGLSAVTSVKVKVTDASGNPVSFDGRGVYQPGGPQSTLTLTPGQNSLKVVLPRGRYSFEDIGTAQDGTFLAYGSSAGVDITATPSLSLPLHALVDPAALTLTLDGDPAQVQPNTALIARLNVQSPSANGVRYTVPTADFGAPTYTPSQASVVSASKLGASLQTAASPGADFNLNVSLQGWVADGAEHASYQTVTASVTKPFPDSVPGAGIYEDDNAAITLTGSGWAIWSRSDAHDGKSKYTFGVNDTLDFEFQGSQVIVYGSAQSDQDIIDVYLDGTLAKSVDLAQLAQQNAGGGEVELFRLSNLTAGVHTMKIVNSGRTTGGGTAFDFDYLEVQ